MLQDHEITEQCTPQPIAEVAKALGVHSDDFLPIGREVAKIHHNAVRRARPRSTPPRLVLVSAITPTPAGEGKTTTTIGLGQAFTRLGESICLTLREPSLGPCMGIKGGATGGGYSQIMPRERINLHFTGDFHAITSANNLLAAKIDNHIYFGNRLGIDPRQVLWRRVMDLNDRSLRNIVLGLGGRVSGTPREGGFDITAASEIMAMLCLANDEEDLRRRINQALIGFSYEGKPVYARDMNVTGAMLALLRDAMYPNLVQALEGTPVLVHGGPFANIAHGCNSVIATKMSMHFADWTLTEAGFGFDLGAEKFFDIKCRAAGLDPNCVVLVATVRALKMHGHHPKDDLTTPDPEAVRAGLPNLEKHLESVQHFGVPVVVALNHFEHDTDEEVEIVRKRCQELGVRFAVSKHYAEGGAGAEALAKEVMDICNGKRHSFKPVYPLEASIPEKIRLISEEIYGANEINFSKVAEQELQKIIDLGYENLPICMAKAPSSLSDNPTLRGRPRNFTINVRSLQVAAGAEFIIVLTGNILRMPGLPREPLAKAIDLIDGEIIGMA